MAEKETCASASSCSRGSCEGCPSASAANQGVRNTAFLEAPNANSNIKHVIGIVSGKGGVGKSLVSALLAVNFQRFGQRVGIMDADITGPSIPKMFGVSNLRADTDGEHIYPQIAHNQNRQKARFYQR